MIHIEILLKKYYDTNIEIVPQDIPCCSRLVSLSQNNRKQIYNSLPYK